MSAIPVVLFAYARPELLRRTLECLRENRVDLIYAFSDGPRTAELALAVQQVRDQLRAVDWCQMVVCRRETNWGLGVSILAGVTQVLEKHDAAIVFEDDLICVPETFRYLSAALKHYRNDERVMSVTGWTHPLITPGNITDLPYFDGRGECLVWGTWARAWRGMQDDAITIMHKCVQAGIDPFCYGADLPAMAESERARNIWAVRFVYWQILNRGLCMRPPWSMVDHIGVGAVATNERGDSWTSNTPFRAAPIVPAQWPEPVENPACPGIYQKMFGGRLTAIDRLRKLIRRTEGKMKRLMREIAAPRR